MTRIRQAILTLALALCTVAAHAQPKGHRPADAPLTQAIHKALPAGATEVNKPLPVHFYGIGKVQVVLYRKSPDDRQIHGLALIPTGPAYHAELLPDPEPGSEQEEQIATSVLSARVHNSELARMDQLLVVLYYTRTPGKSGSQAHGRVYEHEAGSFFLDTVRSAKLEGVRTAAVARLKLAE